MNPWPPSAIWSEALMAPGWSGRLSGARLFSSPARVDLLILARCLSARVGRGQPASRVRRFVGRSESVTAEPGVNSFSNGSPFGLEPCHDPFPGRSLLRCDMHLPLRGLPLG